MRAARISGSKIEAGIAEPCSDSIASSRPSSPRRFCVTSCHDVISRANAGASTGSTSLRSFASERRRIVAQHVGIAPLALRPAGTELALDDPSALDEALQRVVHHRHAHAVPFAASAGVNGPCVRA